MSRLTAPCLLGAMLMLLGTGCEQRIGYFNAISTKNIYATNMNLERLPKTPNVEVENTKFLGLGVTLQDAVDRALDQGHGNLMLDTVVYARSYPLFWGLKVRGTVVTVPSGAGGPGAGGATMPGTAGNR